jgi:phosphoribosylaminoimidazolecarboxamide formyltransferase/IMP cyclohydrolase
MKRAFLSIYNKPSILQLARELLALKVELIASDGTAEFLKQHELAVTAISDRLNLSPRLEGRVKTLHPDLYTGILADRSKISHMRDLEEINFIGIDFVIVDLYPFAKHMDIEQIDVGGVSLLRAAAKNYEHCTVLCHHTDYPLLLEELELHQGEVSLTFRKKMAARAFKMTSALDDSIANWLSDEPIKTISLKKICDLSYGENQQQSSTLYLPIDAQIGFFQHQGKELSHNNLLDLEAGVNLVHEFQAPAAAIIKHTNPCGVALGISMLDAIQNAFNADAKSSFGGIVVLNQCIDRECAAFLNQHFFELIAAPSFTEDALQRFQQKAKLRVLQIAPSAIGKCEEVRSVLNGFLIQKASLSGNFDFITATKKMPLANENEDLEFAFNVVKHVKSNAIIIAQHGITLGIGAGQMSRIDAIELALQKAQGKNVSNAVLASDGFFPFRDNIDRIAEAGIKSIIQPGGSIRDPEIISACDEYGISMILTGRRVFKH